MHCVREQSKKFTRARARTKVEKNKCESRNSEHSWTFLLKLIYSFGHQMMTSRNVQMMVRPLYKYIFEIRVGSQ
jgi:hypothetical protein